MTRHVAAVTIAALLTSAGALAQTQTPRVVTPAEEPAPAQAKPPRPQPLPAGRHENIKLDLTITDQTGPGAPTRKVVTMIVADRERGAIRSRGRVHLGGNRWENVVINVDAVPTIIRDGAAVRVMLGLEYQPQIGTSQGPREQGPKEVEAAQAQPGLPSSLEANLNEQITMILEPGKPLPISQAADPATDRRITVELTATILK